MHLYCVNYMVISQQSLLPKNRYWIKKSNVIGYLFKPQSLVF